MCEDDAFRAAGGAGSVGKHGDVVGFGGVHQGLECLRRRRMTGSPTLLHLFECRQDILAI